jgi:RloB-like protein
MRRGTTNKDGRRRRPDFEGSLDRQPAVLCGRNRLLVCCGAQRTEGDYLRGLQNYVENPATTVTFKSKACSPTQLVAYAVAERERRGGDFDQVWCVFDVDHFTDIQEAVGAAKQDDIHIALSNPCFELWLILHFCDHFSSAGTYKELLPTLRKQLQAYDKAKLRFRDYQDTWPEAVKRAQKLSPVGEEHRRNPATGVWRLVNEIAGRADEEIPAQRSASGRLRIRYPSSLSHPER